VAYPDDGEPVGVRVIDQVRSDLTDINGTGYHHTLREVRVYDGAAISLGSVTGPFALVIPESDQVLDDTTGMIRHSLMLSIVAGLRTMTGSTTWKNELRWLLADITQRFEQDKQLNGLAAYLTATSQEVFEAETTQPLAICRAQYRIEYRHVHDNPSVVT